MLYVRGLINGMLGVESIRKAQSKFGTADDRRAGCWGHRKPGNHRSHASSELGFEGLKPMKVSCFGPRGHPRRSHSAVGRHQRTVVSEWYEPTTR